MSVSESHRVRFALVTIAMLAGCSPASHGSPAPGEAPQARAQRAVASATIFSARGVPFVGSSQAWAAALSRSEVRDAAGQRPLAVAPGTLTVVPKKAKAWGASVFVSDFGTSGNGAVYRFASKKNGKLLGTISDVTNPQGLDSDSKGNLWVASTGDYTLRAYAPDTYTASIVLSDPGEFPVSVAVCPNGTVYASDAYNIDRLPGNIEIYAGGATSPTGVVPDANIYSARFAACDGNNVLWYDYLDYNYNPAVASYDGTSVTEYGNLGLTPYTAPGGLRTAINGTTLAIMDQGSLTLDLFTKSNPGGGPYATLGKLFSEPVSFSFIKTDKNVWVADASKDEAIEATLKGKEPATLGTGTLHLPIDAYVFPTGNT